ncbi:Uncharacterized protein TCM_042125 [Theobroma cacao]|uniref:Uncharacterized protein n=1 Tax=Theobroma cacao TaxID=3641 RepID=A0A061GY81_THECC|nr:Uncharacterized protein TCM_042125 [Theobroma cacao]
MTKIAHLFFKLKRKKKKKENLAKFVPSSTSMVYEKAKGQRGREYVKGTKTETVVVVGTLSPSTSQQPPLSRGVVAPSVRFPCPFLSFHHGNHRASHVTLPPLPPPPTKPRPSFFLHIYFYVSLGTTAFVL